MTTATIEACTTPTSIADTGKVRIGDVSPAFPPVRRRPANIDDAGKVRIGDVSPAFPPLRVR
jgi:hypothetical protein